MVPKRIDVKGNIINSSNGWVYDWLGIENTTPKKVNSLLQEANGEDVDVYINSPGGMVQRGWQSMIPCSILSVMLQPFVLD